MSSFKQKLKILLNTSDIIAPKDQESDFTQSLLKAQRIVKKDSSINSITNYRYINNSNPLNKSLPSTRNINRCFKAYNKSMDIKNSSYIPTNSNKFNIKRNSKIKYPECPQKLSNMLRSITIREIHNQNKENNNNILNQINKNDYKTERVLSYNIKRKIEFMEKQCFGERYKAVIINRPPRRLNQPIYNFDPKEFSFISPASRKNDFKYYNKFNKIGMIRPPVKFNGLI